MKKAANYGIYLVIALAIILILGFFINTETKYSTAKAEDTVTHVSVEVEITVTSKSSRDNNIVFEYDNMSIKRNSQELYNKYNINDKVPGTKFYTVKNGRDILNKELKLKGER